MRTAAAIFVAAALFAGAVALGVLRLDSSPRSPTVIDLRGWAHQGAAPAPTRRSRIAVPQTVHERRVPPDGGRQP